jgi:transposase
MKPIQLPPLNAEQLKDLNELYRKTRDPRLRTRAQIILLVAEKQLTAEKVGEIVRLSDQAVRKWLKRYLAEGIEGLRDLPRAGTPRKVTAAYLSQ